MGLFSRKTAVIDAPPVEFDRERAQWLTNVHNLAGNLREVAATVDWPDRSVPSPVLQATMRPAVDTYGKSGNAVYVGKTCIGFLGRPADRALNGAPVAIVLETRGDIMLALGCRPT